MEDDGPAPGGTGGVDRALNGGRVVGLAITLRAERMHRCARTHGSCDGSGACAENPKKNDCERGLHCHSPQQSVASAPNTWRIRWLDGTPELRKLAARHLGKERQGHTLQATARCFVGVVLG